MRGVWLLRREREMAAAEFLSVIIVSLLTQMSLDWSIQSICLTSPRVYNNLHIAT